MKEKMLVHDTQESSDTNDVEEDESNSSLNDRLKTIMEKPNELNTNFTKLLKLVLTMKQD